MPYSTIARVQVAVGGAAKLLQLTDQDSAGSVDSDVVDQAIATADGIIDSYLGKRFAVPLATVPESIAGLSTYWAARILRRNDYQGQPLLEDTEAEKTDREWLAGVAKGEIALGIEPNLTAASIVIDKAAPRDSTLSISRERMKGFI